MQVLLLGAGTVTARLNMQLAEQGHAVVAQIAAFTPQHLCPRRVWFRLPSAAN
jgi:hypothetical protein